MQRILILTILFLSVAGSWALRCYVCNDAAGCKDPVASQEQACAESQCFKAQIKDSTGGAGVSRGCGKPPGSADLPADKCSSQIKIVDKEYTICTCGNKDLCNSAGTQKISLIATGISVFMAMILTKFL